jgi:hypothetical protein
MAFRRLRKLVHRARQAGSDEPQGFGQTQAAAFAQIEIDAEGAFQLLGAALVSTWEVGITEVGRALMDKIPETDRKTLVNRVSDGLVPVQQPLQDTGHGVGAAIKQGVQAGQMANRLGPATEPLAALVAPLGTQIEAGWQKATDYLAPVFAVLPNTDEVTKNFGEGGALLAEAFHLSATRFAADLDKVPNGDATGPALSDAIHTWQRAVCRSVEIIVFARMSLIANAAKQMNA